MCTRRPVPLHWWSIGCLIRPEASGRGPEEYRLVSAWCRSQGVGTLRLSALAVHQLTGILLRGPDRSPKTAASAIAGFACRAHDKKFMDEPQGHTKLEDTSSITSGLRPRFCAQRPRFAAAAAPIAPKTQFCVWCLRCFKDKTLALFARVSGIVRSSLGSRTLADESPGEFSFSCSLAFRALRRSRTLQNKSRSR